LGFRFCFGAGLALERVEHFGAEPVAMGIPVDALVILIGKIRFILP